MRSVSPTENGTSEAINFIGAVMNGKIFSVYTERTVEEWPAAATYTRRPARSLINEKQTVRASAFLTLFFLK